MEGIAHVDGDRSVLVLSCVLGVPVLFFQRSSHSSFHSPQWLASKFVMENVKTRPFLEQRRVKGRMADRIPRARSWSVSSSDQQGRADTHTLVGEDYKLEGVSGASVQARCDRAAPPPSASFELT